MRKVNKTTWLEQMQSQPNESLKQLYLSHQKPLTAWLIKEYACSEEEATDFFQEAVIILYRKVVNRYLQKTNHSLEDYLFAILKRLAYEAGLSDKILFNLSELREQLVVKELYFVGLGQGFEQNLSQMQLVKAPTKLHILPHQNAVA